MWHAKEVFHNFRDYLLTIKKAHSYSSSEWNMHVQYKQKRKHESLL